MDYRKSFFNTYVKRSAGNLAGKAILKYCLFFLLVCVSKQAVASPVYAYDGSSIYETASDLTGITTLISGYGFGTPDMAAGADGLYFCNGSNTWKTDLDGTNLYTSGSAFNAIAAGPDGYVYAYDGSSIFRMSSDMTGLTTLITGYGFGSNVDMAAGEDGLYFCDGSNTWKTDLDGQNIQGSGAAFSAIAVGPDNYLYGFAGTSIFRFNSDLTGFTMLASGYGFGSNVDMAAGEDGLYFCDGTNAWKTDLNGLNPYTSGAAFSAIAVQSIPEPTIMSILAIGSFTVFLKRRKNI